MYHPWTIVFIPLSPILPLSPLYHQSYPTPSLPSLITPSHWIHLPLLFSPHHPLIQHTSLNTPSSQTPSNTPSSTLSYSHFSHPHLPHGQVVQTIRAVEDHTLYCQCLGQVLHCLCLTSTYAYTRTFITTTTPPPQTLPAGPSGAPLRFK